MDNKNEIMVVEEAREASQNSDTGWIAAVEAAVSQIENENEARGAIDNMTTLKHRLEEQKMLKKFACDFCRLEAEMWIRIATSNIDVEGSDLFTRREKNLVVWIGEKSASELRKIVARCARGIRLSNIKDSENSKRNSDEREKEYKRISEFIISEGEKNGVTTLNNDVFYQNWDAPGKPDPVSVSAYNSRTQKELIAEGFIGLGDGSGTYVSLTSGDNDQKAEAIATRVKSIIDDLGKLKRICTENCLTIPKSAFVRLHDAVDALPLAGAKE